MGRIIKGKKVLTYGPGKGACILRLTLQSVPLETKTKVERNAQNEQKLRSPSASIELQTEK